jgi:hypothetical protein
MSLSLPPAKRRKTDGTAFKKRPASVPLALFLTDICGFDPKIPATLAKSAVTSSEHLAVLRDEDLERLLSATCTSHTFNLRRVLFGWFRDPYKFVTLRCLQTVRRFLELNGDPQGVTDFADLRLQTGRLNRATESAPDPTLADSSNSTHTDDLIRLMFVDGRVLRCSRSTLSNGGGYLAARFGLDSLIPPGAKTYDANGQTVFFIERDGELFEKYIFSYLMNNGLDLLQFTEAPTLWRQLRREAAFYSLDGLSEWLHVTKTFEPDPDSQGVLYWLGTNKGVHEYRNPLAIGAVRVGGWVDLSIEARIALRGDKNIKLPMLAAIPSSLQSLVQYRPPVLGSSNPDSCLLSLNSCFNLGYGFSDHRFPVVINLQSISLRLTAYSLRYDIHGMSYWNLEASDDGSNWDVLHAARGDPYLLEPSVEKNTWLKKNIIESEVISTDEKSECLLSYVEQNHRHTWNIDPSPIVFYRFFRLIGIGTDMPEGDDVNRCMHAVGLELYGDVHEE